MYRNIALTYIMFCLSLGIIAQPSVDLLSANEGLSQGMVFDILQAKDDYLWIATKGGLNRYDGHRFKVFSTDLFDPFSIATTEAHKLFEDSRGWIWVVYQHGIDVYEPGSGRFFHLKKADLPAFDAADVVIAETPDGTIWIVANDDLWRIEAYEASLQKSGKENSAILDFKCSKIAPPKASGSGNSIKFNSIALSKDQHLLLGTDDGLYSLNPKSPSSALIPESLTGKLLYLVGEDREGRIWMHLNSKRAYSESLYWAAIVGTPASELWVRDNRSSLPRQVNSSREILWHLDRAKNQFWCIEGNAIRTCPAPDLAGNVKPSLATVLDHPVCQVPDIGYYCIIVDKSGVVWISTNGYGLLKHLTTKPKFSSYAPLTTHRGFYEDPQGRIFSIIDQDKIYMPGQFGASQPNPWFAQSNAVLPKGKKPYAVAFDAAGNCWANMGVGWSPKPNSPLEQFMCIDAQTKAGRLIQPPMGCAGLIAGSNGKMFSLNFDGLVEIDPVSERFLLHPFDSTRHLSHPNYSFPNPLLEGPKGILWLFGYEGLIKASPTPKGYRFDYFKNAPLDRSTLSNNTVLSVATDPLEPERYLWVGTRGGGLNRLDLHSGKFKHYGLEQGLPDNIIYGVLASPPPVSSQSGSDGYLWLSTNKGLCRFHVRDESVKVFTEADGLQNNEFNQSSYFKTRDGHFIFGGINGFSVFHPDSLIFNQHLPQTHIVGLQVNNRPFPLPASALVADPSSLNLSHDQNLITLEFAALDFTNPSQNLYRYQLIQTGLFGDSGDEDWVILGNKNTVQFANLQPGRYTFKVQGSNNDGLWSEQPAELRFTIRPPWWKSWVAYLFYLGAIAAIGWLFYQYRILQRLGLQEALRLKELDDFKSRFFTNITHEFRTQLTVILGMTERLTADGGRLTDGDAQGKLGLIKRNGENLLRLINQILDLAKLESKSLKINYVQGDVLPYLRYISESLHSLANAQNVLLRAESKEAEIVMDYDPERLLQIVYNLLSNAIKFTPSGGKVLMRADVKHAWLHLSVSDSGVGVPPDELPFLFDRFFQAKNQEHAKAGGTGIGLSLTHEVVKALGGEISVESTLGVGSTFLVKLPMTNKSAFLESGANGSLEGRKPVTATLLLPTEKQPADPNLPLILLIEDNPDVVEYLAACLSSPSRAGSQGAYQLDFAYNGRAGIEKALETIPDLIVSDVMMPEKDGFEVVETLKHNELTSHIPIVLLTAKADVQSRIAGLKRGADAYLSKPFHQEELLATLANLLEQRKRLQAKYSDGRLMVSDSLPQSPITNHQSPVSDPEDALLQKVQTAVLDNLSDSNFKVEDLCRAVATGQSQLNRKLMALTGMSTIAFIRSTRLAKAKELLLAKEMNISEVAYAVGFDDPKYFSRAFMEQFGIAPSKL